MGLLKGRQAGESGLQAPAGGAGGSAAGMLIALSWGRGGTRAL